MRPDPSRMTKLHSIRQKRRFRSSSSDSQTGTVDALTLQKREHRREWFVVLLLLTFGVYQSILFYQHQPVPSSDFPAFTGTAWPLLHFKLPGSFKRVPLVGLLQIAVSQFCPGPYPLLTGGWVLNGILHALSILLFYRVGKHLLGRNAFYFAVLAGINPWVLQMVTDPIAETTMIFLTLLTFDFLFRRSRWCYLFAMLASMARYELTALIAIAFCVDMVLGESRKDRIRAFVLAFLASIPMVLWMILWRVYRPADEGYVGHFTGSKPRLGLAYWKLLWQTTFGPLLQMPSWVGVVFGKVKVASQPQATAIQQAAGRLEVMTWIVTGAGTIFSLVYAAIRKNWKFWALFAFWGVYVGAHSLKHATLDRYTIPVIWLTLLIVFYGLQSIGTFIREKWSVPGFIPILGQIIVLGICLAWAIRLATVLPATVRASTDSVSLVYAAIGVVVLFLAGRAWIMRQRPPILRSVTILAVCGLLLISNQFQVVRVLGNGTIDAEFKALADWYRRHAQPGEKLATTLPSVVQLFVPGQRHCIVHTGTDSATTFPEFITECYRRGITYVAWDSRLGFASQDYYYKNWNLQKTAPLSQPRDVGPFEFVGKIEQSPRRYMYIFKLRPPDQQPAVRDGKN